MYTNCMHQLCQSMNQLSAVQSSLAFISSDQETSKAFIGQIASSESKQTFNSATFVRF